MGCQAIGLFMLNDMEIQQNQNHNKICDYIYIFTSLLMNSYSMHEMLLKLKHKQLTLLFWP